MKIKFKSIKIGNDFLIIITGGKEHLGAVTFDFKTITKKSHKDDVITKMVFKMIHKKLNKNVMVVCGIHKDNATKNDINKIIKKVKRRTKKWINKQN